MLHSSRLTGVPTGHARRMIWAFLSTRLRTWLLFAVVLPIAGRLLEALGVRVGQRNARAGDALTKVGGYARRPTKGRGRGRL